MENIEIYKNTMGEDMVVIYIDDAAYSMPKSVYDEQQAAQEATPTIN